MLFVSNAASAGRRSADQLTRMMHDEEQQRKTDRVALARDRLTGHFTDATQEEQYVDFTQNVSIVTIGVYALGCGVLFAVPQWFLGNDPFSGCGPRVGRDQIAHLAVGVVGFLVGSALFLVRLFGHRLLATPKYIERYFCVVHLIWMTGMTCGRSGRFCEGFTSQGLPYVPGTNSERLIFDVFGFGLTFVLLLGTQRFVFTLAICLYGMILHFTIAAFAHGRSPQLDDLLMVVVTLCVLGILFAEEKSMRHAFEDQRHCIAAAERTARARRDVDAIIGRRLPAAVLARLRLEDEEDGDENVAPSAAGGGQQQAAGAPTDGADSKDKASCSFVRGEGTIVVIRLSWTYQSASGQPPASPDVSPGGGRAGGDVEWGEDIQQQLRDVADVVDDLAITCGGYVVTAGDAGHVVVSFGVPFALNTTHASRATTFASRLKATCTQRMGGGGTPLRRPTATTSCLTLHMGVHTGRLLACVLPPQRLAYQLIGQTVDVAVALATLASANTILCTEHTIRQLRRVTLHSMPVPPQLIVSSVADQGTVIPIDNGFTAAASASADTSSGAPHTKEAESSVGGESSGANVFGSGTGLATVVVVDMKHRREASIALLAKLASETPAGAKLQLQLIHHCDSAAIDAFSFHNAVGSGTAAEASSTTGGSLRGASTAGLPIAPAATAGSSSGGSGDGASAGDGGWGGSESFKSVTALSRATMTTRNIISQRKRLLLRRSTGFARAAATYATTTDTAVGSHVNLSPSSDGSAAPSGGAHAVEVDLVALRARMEERAGTCFSLAFKDELVERSYRAYAQKKFVSFTAMLTASFCFTWCLSLALVMISDVRDAVAYALTGVACAFSATSLALILTVNFRSVQSTAGSNSVVSPATSLAADAPITPRKKRRGRDRPLLDNVRTLRIVIALDSASYFIAYSLQLAAVFSLAHRSFFSTSTLQAYPMIVFAIIGAVRCPLGVAFAPHILLSAVVLVGTWIACMFTFGVVSIGALLYLPIAIPVALGLGIAQREQASRSRYLSLTLADVANGESLEEGINMMAIASRFVPPSLVLEAVTWAKHQRPAGRLLRPFNEHTHPEGVGLLYLTIPNFGSIVDATTPRLVASIGANLPQRVSAELNDEARRRTLAMLRGVTDIYRNQLSQAPNHIVQVWIRGVTIFVMSGWGTDEGSGGGAQRKSFPVGVADPGLPPFCHHPTAANGRSSSNLLEAPIGTVAGRDGATEFGAPVGYAAGGLFDGWQFDDAAAAADRGDVEAVKPLQFAADVPAHIRQLHVFAAAIIGDLRGRGAAAADNNSHHGRADGAEDDALDTLSLKGAMIAAELTWASVGWLGIVGDDPLECQAGVRARRILSQSSTNVRAVATTLLYLQPDTHRGVV